MASFTSSGVGIATTLLRNNVIRIHGGAIHFQHDVCRRGNAVHEFCTEVPKFAVTIAWVHLGIASIAAFFFLIDYTARSLRPVSIVWRIGEDGIKVIENVYPEMSGTTQIAPTPVSVDANARTVSHSSDDLGDRAGRQFEISRVLIAINARMASSNLSLALAISVATGSPLFRSWHGGAARDR